MKIWIENSSKNQNELNGKSLFCNRLAKVFTKSGIEVVDGKEPADVSINVISLKHKNSKVKILRLDGVWHDTAKNYRQKNKALKESLEKADGVIYQSEFAKRMCDKYLGKPKCPTEVIYNGADISYFKTIEPTQLKYKYNFIAFSKWRPHKRLRDIIHSFLDADIKDSQLLIAGPLSKSGMHDSEINKLSIYPNIQFLGNLTQDELIPIIKGCNASIHLCWFDACPNSVVESLCCNVPVICNNVGGTPELIKLTYGGIICNVDKEYDMNPVDLYNPPKIDRSIISKAFVDVIENEINMVNKRIDILNTAIEYFNFIVEVGKNVK